MDLLKVREGDVPKGQAVTPKIGRFTFDDAVADVLLDYTTNGKKSAGDVSAGSGST